MSSPTAASATVNGVLLRYWTWEGTGQPLVLLHGLASTRRIWDFVAPLLAQDFRVIALDQRHFRVLRPRHVDTLRLVPEDR